MELDFIKECQAYLLYYTYRALARCGSKEGLMGLAELTGDTRLMVSKNSMNDLMSIKGLDLGLKSEEWIKAINDWNDDFDTKPWIEVID